MEEKRKEFMFLFTPEYERHSIFWTIDLVQSARIGVYYDTLNLNHTFIEIVQIYSLEKGKFIKI